MLRKKLVVAVDVIHDADSTVEASAFGKTGRIWAFADLAVAEALAIVGRTAFLLFGALTGCLYSDSILRRAG